MNPSPTNRLLRAVTLLALAASLVCAAIGTLHWPIVGDAPMQHYVVFLMDHGLAPYRQIFDLNAPGTYTQDWLSIHLLGPGPLAWRLWDFTLIALCILAATLISKAAQNDALPGFFAGTLFALIHFRDGPTHTAQRDFYMTTLLLLACAALAYATKPGAPGLHSRTRVNDASGQPRTITLYALTGLCLGMATIIKPSGILFAATILTLLYLHTRKLQPLAISIATTLIAPIACTLWLRHHHSLTAFIAMSRGLDAYHASLGRPPLANLIIGSFPTVLLAVAIPAVPLFFTTRTWKARPTTLLIACTLIGCASYIIQGKGYPYHRYPTEAFLCLVIALTIFPHITNPTWRRYPAILTVLLGACFLAPASAAIACHFDGRNQEFNHQLAADLTTLHATNNQVQCVDTTAGCINTLYNLQLVQATGFFYDCYLFQPQPAAFREQYRANFLAALQQSRPQFIVATDQECFTMNRSFALFDRWPAFTTLLATDYTLTTQYTPPHTIGWWRHPAQPFSYRIYTRNDTATKPANR